MKRKRIEPSVWIYLLSLCLLLNTAMTAVRAEGEEPSEGNPAENTQEVYEEPVNTGVDEPETAGVEESNSEDPAEPAEEYVPDSVSEDNESSTVSEDPEADGQDIMEVTADETAEDEGDKADPEDFNVEEPQEEEPETSMPETSEQELPKDESVEEEELVEDILSEEIPAEEGEVQPDEQYIYKEAVHINPIYEGLVSEDELFSEEPEEMPDSEEIGELLGSSGYYYANFNQAAEGLRNAILQHTKKPVLYYVFPESFEKHLVDSTVIDLAFSGLNDYYDASVIGYEIHTSYYFPGNGTIKGVLMYTLEYSTTKKQEADFETRVKKETDKLNIYNKSEYEKVKAIYTYICSKVTYDYTHLYDDNYNLKYSAYAALINHTAVCHGYAALFQKMASIAGLNAHFIGGEGGEGYDTEPHAWNSVSVNGKYYLLDSTWDSVYGSSFSRYEWFMRGRLYFQDTHDPNDSYGSEYSWSDYVNSSPSKTPVSSLTVKAAKGTLYIGDTTELIVTVKPANAKDKRVTFKSSNNNVASVDRYGNVTGKKKGTVTITVTTADGKKKATCKITVKNPDANILNGFWYYGDNYYWYENGKRQGMRGDPKNLYDIKYHVERGREIYDPESNGWYWLDAAYGGAKAVGKEVWMPYIYQEEDYWSYEQKVNVARGSDPGMENCVLNAMLNKDGKWVRYDGNGAMMKGWVTITGYLANIYPKQRGNTYYYDTHTGLMAKGWVVLEGWHCYFNEVTGVFERYYR